MRYPIKDTGVVNERSLDCYNLEMADQGNPEGAIFKDVLAIHCNSEDGHKFVLMQEFDADKFDEAEAFALRVRYHGSINLQLWIEIEPVYGTQAWLEWDAGATLDGKYF
jgi:hypothetical protein